MDKAEALARKFHDTYERLAPSFGYATRDDTKAFDPTTPNGRLMIAVCGELSPNIHHGKETSSRVSSIAGTILAQLRKNPEHTGVSLSREDAEALAGSCMSQDETPGQQPGPGPHYIPPSPVEQVEALDEDDGA